MVAKTRKRHAFVQEDLHTVQKDIIYIIAKTCKDVKGNVK